MNKEQLIEAIKEAYANGDIQEITRIKRALYYAKVKAAEEREEKERRSVYGDESFVTKSKRDDAPELKGRKIRTDIPRPNLFYDEGSYQYGPKENKLYVKPPTSRSRPAFKMVEAVCSACNGTFEVHPTEYAQRTSMENGQFVCDGCIGQRFKK